MQLIIFFLTGDGTAGSCGDGATVFGVVIKLVLVSAMIVIVLMKVRVLADVLMTLVQFFGGGR